MTLDLSPLRFSFSQKPLLIGGKAMEYYGLRTAGDDIDFIVTVPDFAMDKPKYHTDLELVVQKIKDTQYAHFAEMQQENENILTTVKDKIFIEKVGPNNSQTSFQTAFEDILKILASNEKLQIKNEKLLSVSNGQIRTAVGEASSFLLNERSALENQFVSLDAVRNLVDSMTKNAALIRLNHIGFCYKVASLAVEQERLQQMVQNSNMNLYVEPSNDESIWFFVGNTDAWEEMMIELLPVEKTKDTWKDYWLPHIQIDIDTNVSEAEIKRYVAAAFGEHVTPFSITIDDVVYIVRNRLGTIDGVNIVIDLATNSRNVQYQRQSLLQRVDLAE